jgi:acyl-CoA synthetase (NDP forming)
MLASNLTMGRRGLPFAYVISAGNQSLLGVEDYLEVLIEDPAVTGVGLYVEELRDVPRFAKAALGALAKGIPIVALKAGRSELGARLTESHTGSLSGADEVYQALFDRLGILRVDSPAQLLETLKMLTLAGVPKGPRLAGFTCSGGDALMLADGAEAAGLVFRQPSPEAARELAGRLPEIATVSNPLDYTTPLWGDRENLPKVFKTMLADGYDAALLVQDYPAPDLEADKESYLSDCRAFMAAARAAGIPAAVASSVPENLDRETREMIAAAGVAPLQGVGEALSALGQASRYGARRARIEADPAALRLPAPPPPAGAPESLDEWAGKRWLAAAGIPLPDGRLVDAAGAAAAAAEIGFPVAVKAVSPRLIHKTEAGAVALDLADGPAVTAAVAAISRALASQDPEAADGPFLVERMVRGAVAELLIGIRRDPRFGLVMVLASGGLLVELVGDSVTLLLPAGREQLSEALDSLKVAKQIAGYRGRPAGDRAAVLEVLVMLADFAQTHAARIAELEINPLMVTQEGAFAVDVLLRAVPGAD